MWSRNGIKTDMVDSPESDAVVVCVSELGFRRTRRRTGRSTTLSPLSSSVEQEASTMGSSTRVTRAEGTNLDLLGRSLETGLIKFLSWLLPCRLECRPDDSDRLEELRSDDRETVGRLLLFGDSGCARICVTRLLRLSAFMIGSDGTQVVLWGFFSTGFPFSKNPLLSAMATHFSSSGLEYITSCFILSNDFASATMLRAADLGSLYFCFSKFSMVNKSYASTILVVFPTQRSFFFLRNTLLSKLFGKVFGGAKLSRRGMKSPYQLVWHVRYTYTS